MRTKAERVSFIIFLISCLALLGQIIAFFDYGYGGDFKDLKRCMFGYCENGFYYNKLIFFLTSFILIVSSIRTFLSKWTYDPIKEWVNTGDIRALKNFIIFSMWRGLITLNNSSKNEVKNRRSGISFLDILKYRRQRALLWGNRHKFEMLWDSQITYGYDANLAIALKRLEAGSDFILLHYKEGEPLSAESLIKAQDIGRELEALISKRFAKKG